MVATTAGKIRGTVEDGVHVTGVPRHPRLPEWPGYDPVRRATLLLDEPSRVVDDPLGEERRLWAGVRI
jgi:carboxylesterase type B